MKAYEYKHISWQIYIWKIILFYFIKDHRIDITFHRVQLQEGWKLHPSNCFLEKWLV